MIRTISFLVVLIALGVLPSVFAQNEGRPNTRLDNAVRKALHADPFRHVHASAQNGIVTLVGFVDLYQTRSNAEDRVSRVRGVQLIRNQLQVLAPVVPDRQLEKNVETAMAYSEFQQYGYLPDMHKVVSVQASNGVVTLAGVVPGRPLAARLFAAAAETKGVRAIVDLRWPQVP
jgi:osmotically-inducible protein OsmY